MTAKTQFLWQLTTDIEQTEREAVGGGARASRMAAYLRALHEQVAELPADHKLFVYWQRTKWRPVGLQTAA